MLPAFHQYRHRTSGYPAPGTALRSHGFLPPHNPDVALPHRPCPLSSGPENAIHHPGLNSRDDETHNGPHTLLKMHSDDSSFCEASFPKAYALPRHRTDNPSDPPAQSL